MSLDFWQYSVYFTDTRLGDEVELTFSIFDS